MQRTCDSCHQTFETLTAYRLHKPDCHANEAYDISELSVDDIAGETTQQLLTCRDCGTVNDEAADVDPRIVDGRLSVMLRFVCSHCQTDNENTAFLES